MKSKLCWKTQFCVSLFRLVEPTEIDFSVVELGYLRGLSKTFGWQMERARNLVT